LSAGISRDERNPLRGGFPENWNSVRPLSHITNRWRHISLSEPINGANQGLLNHGLGFFPIRPILAFGQEKFVTAGSGKDDVILLGNQPLIISKAFMCASTNSPAKTRVRHISLSRVTFTMKSTPTVFATSKPSSWHGFPSRMRLVALGSSR